MSEGEKLVPQGETPYVVSTRKPILCEYLPSIKRSEVTLYEYSDGTGTCTPGPDHACRSCPATLWWKERGTDLQSYNLPDSLQGSRLERGLEISLGAKMTPWEVLRNTVLAVSSFNDWILNGIEKKFNQLIPQQNEPKVMAPETRALLENLSEDIVTQISFQGFEEPLKFKNTVVKFNPNSQTFAQTILQMAYLEGGINEVDKVTKFVRERGIDISVSMHHMPLVFAWVFPSLAPERRVKMGLSDHVLEVYWATQQAIPFRELRGNTKLEFILSAGLTVYAIPHELYHIIQEARNPRYKAYRLTERAVHSFLVIPIVVGAIQMDAGLFIKGLLTALGILTYSPPSELEAFLKTTVPGRFNLLLDPSFDNLRDKLFSFEEASAYLLMNRAFD